jgi:uncharacterized protein (TIGR02687 family)
MDTTQLVSALNRLFHDQGDRLVFWSDSNREFEQALPALSVAGVRVLRVDQEGALAIKLRVEREDPVGKYLIYAPGPEPQPEDDWLLDIRLYSHTFRADRASIVLDDLGLANHALRAHIEDRRRFFENKDRVQRLQTWVQPQDGALDLDRKMMAVLVRAEQSDLFSILLSVFQAMAGHASSGGRYPRGRAQGAVMRDEEASTDGGAADGMEDGEADLNRVPKIWSQVVRVGLEGAFWEMIQTTFGYTEGTPSLRNLLIQLLVTDYAHSLRGALPPSLQHLVLPVGQRQNVITFLSQWRDSATRGASYDALSELVAEVLKLESHLDRLELDVLMPVTTFLAVEKTVARALRDRVQQTADTINAEAIRRIARQRQDGYWASPTVMGLESIPRTALHAVYEALGVAADFFALRNEWRSRFTFTSASELYQAYEKELFRFDQLYRHFCESADLAEAKGWGILKSLRQEVEASYGNGFVMPLALAWGTFLDGAHAQGLLREWRIEKRPNQQDFFARQVGPKLDQKGGRRVFVIVSDAFRYEAAEELTQELNGKYRFEAELKSQLGVLPSYTALGMASLLPHQALAYKPTGEVQVNGKSASSLDQRSALLAGWNGVAVRGEELLAMTRDAGREFVRDWTVVYVYHNTVDATGDNAATEAKTFAAVRQAIGELGSLVSHIINNLNGSQVLVTADHGFLFQESAPESTHRSGLDEKPEGTVLAKKRYLLGHGLPDHEDVWHGSTRITAQAEGDMEFWIPKGVNRFHFTGGARFIHGGAMPQEIVVPVIEVRALRGSAAQSTKARQVAVHVLGGNHRVTTARHRFELLQTEAVSDRVKAITLKVALYDGDEVVTNIEKVTFDSASDILTDRQKWVTLVLLDRTYDKRKPYRLVLREAETGIEQTYAEVTIDRAFTEDF